MVFKKLHAFPVDRKNPGPSSIKIPIKILKEEKIVGIFPSGTRTTEDVPLKRGAVTIANMAKVPIVPAYYKGPNTLKELFKGKKAMLIIGEPIFLEKTETNKVDLQYYTNQLSHVFSELEKKLQEYQK